MIENLKISLWDLFVYFFSGIIISLSISIHLFINNSTLYCLFIKVFKNSELTSLVLIGTISVILGLLFEPISNFLNDVITPLKSRLKKYVWKKLFVFSYFTDRWHDDLIKNCEKEVIDSIPSKLRDKIKPYQWAKDYIVQNNISAPYMPFLSKYGFYRNLGFIFYLNALVLIILYGWHVKIIITAVTFILIGVLSRYRSDKFFNHLTATIFQHYLISINKK